MEEEFPITVTLGKRPGPVAIDAILNAVLTACEIHNVEQPIIMVGKPPFATVYTPTVEEYERRIVAEEAGNVHAD